MDRSFYDKWAVRQLDDPQRDSILKWKASNLANLFLRTFPGENPRFIAEIGGAEGTVLQHVGELLDAEHCTNFELSAEFCRIGEQKFPEIRFQNFAFPENSECYYDIIILSDILEHVEDDVQLLFDVSVRTDYVLSKIPIEDCVLTNDLLRWVVRRPKCDWLRYGPTHFNGHLRGYTTHRARKTISRYFEIMDAETTDLLFFYGSARRKSIRRPTD